MKKIVYLLACVVVISLVFLNVFCTPFVPDPSEVLLTVQVTGTGRITSVPAGIDSTSTISHVFPLNTVVTLQARTTNGSGSFFSGWSGDGTGSFRDLTITLDAPKTVTADFGSQGWPSGNLIFVSSTVQASSLGVSGFDAVCNSLATTAGINNAAGNGFRAWVSTSATHAYKNVPLEGYTRLDGSVVFTELKDAIDPGFGSRIHHPINIDEQGGVISSAEPVWTGTNVDGSVSSGYTCNDWSGTGNGRVGTTHGGPALWTSYSVAPCSGMMARVYCMGIVYDVTVPIPATPAGSKYIYLSNNTAKGDAVLGADCSGAGSGSKVVLASTTTAAASSYINPTTLYVTPSGVVVGTGADIVSGNTRTGIWQHGDGSFSSGVESVYTGSPSVSQTGTLASTCQDWTSQLGIGAITGSTRMGPEWWNMQTINCSQPAYTYCVEQ